MTKRMAREPKTVTEQISSDEAAAEARTKSASVPSSAPVPAPAPHLAPAPARTTKIEAVISLLRREEGATLGDLVEATGWLPHTTRAALTGLRKKGHMLDKSKRDDVTCYRIVEAA